MKCHDEEMGRDRKMEVGVVVDDDDMDGGGYDGYDENDYSDDDAKGYSEGSDDDDSTGSVDEYATAWPQSYRASIDMLSSVASPNVVEFIGGSSLSRFGQSFLRPPSPSREDSVTASLLPEGDATASSRLLTSPQLPVSSSISKCLSARRSMFLSYHGLSQVPSGGSFSQAVVNGINVLCGVGILTTPYAIKSGGWLGLPVLIGLGIISCYTGILLKRCLDSSPGLRTYPDIGQAAFGTAGRYGIATILYMELYASCVEYIILVSDNLSTIFPKAHIYVAGRYLGSHQLFAVTAAITVLPTVLLRDLSLLSYLSAGGVIASVVVVSCLIWVGVIDGIGLHPAGRVLDLTNLPVAIGLYGFCFAGHSVFPNIYSSMNKKSEFPAVLLVCWVPDVWRVHRISIYSEHATSVCGYEDRNLDHGHKSTHQVRPDNDSSSIKLRGTPARVSIAIPFYTGSHQDGVGALNIARRTRSSIFRFCDGTGWILPHHACGSYSTMCMLSQHPTPNGWQTSGRGLYPHCCNRRNMRLYRHIYDNQEHGISLRFKLTNPGGLF